MTIDSLWQELEQARIQALAHTGQPDDFQYGWVLRLVRPDPLCALSMGVELGTGRRALLLRVDQRHVPAKRQWPSCKGLEVIASPAENGQVLFGVVLREPQYADVFSILAEDLARRATEALGPAARAVALLTGLGLWQKFLASSLEGLGEELQRGLWGELHLLCEHLIPFLGPEAVMAWKGGHGAAQDFQLPTVAIEVKTTLSKRPQTVRITSERQLDNTGWDAFFLCILSIESRDAALTLPRMVSSIRSLLSDDVMASARFEEELVEYGYVDAHAPRYSGSGFAVREEHFFAVQNGFPRILESDLPQGVGDVNYTLDVAACMPLRVGADVVLAALEHLKRT